MAEAMRAPPARRSRGDRRGADRACRRLTVGGSGSSGSAAPGCSATRCSRTAWGAEVGGWDRVETPYLEPLRAAGSTSRSRPSPRRPDGLGGRRLDARTRRVAGGRGRSCSPSSSRCGLDRRRRRARQDDDGGDDRVLPRRLGLDPRLVGGEVPQLGGNARAGEGWLVVEGDESDRIGRRAAARDRRAPERRSRPSRDVRLARRGGGAVRAVARAGAARRARQELAPVDSSWRCPASTTAATRRRRSPRSSSPASRGRAAAVLAAFRGRGRRLELRGEARRRARVRRLRAPSGRGRRDDRRGARASAAGACSSLFQPHLYSRTRHLAHEFGAALAAADAVVRHGDLRGARGSRSPA